MSSYLTFESAMRELEGWGDRQATRLLRSRRRVRAQRVRRMEATMRRLDGESLKQIGASGGFTAERARQLSAEGAPFVYVVLKALKEEG